MLNSGENHSIHSRVNKGNLGQGLEGKSTCRCLVDVCVWLRDQESCAS